MFRLVELDPLERCMDHRNVWAEVPSSVAKQNGQNRLKLSTVEAIFSFFCRRQIACEKKCPSFSLQSLPCSEVQRHWTLQAIVRVIPKGSVSARNLCLEKLYHTHSAPFMHGSHSASTRQYFLIVCNGIRQSGGRQPGNGTWRMNCLMVCLGR